MSAFVVRGEYSLEKLSFKGGFHAPDHKELSNKHQLTEAPLPESVTISLHQHIGAPCAVLVKKNDTVKTGQMIGEAKATISAPVHASISGTVTGVDEAYSINGLKTTMVTILSDGKDELGYEIKNNDYTQMTPEQMIDLVRRAGVIGLGGAGFPASAKMTKRRPDQQIETVILNGAECEPYLTSDQMAMEHYPEKVLTGLAIIMRAMGAKKGIIGVEDNKSQAIQILRERVSQYPNMQIASLKTKYPQGDMRRLIQAITGKKLPKSTSSTTEGIQVFNTSTAMAIYDAVILEKPLYEKIVTMTGHALQAPQNLWTRVGTSISELINLCGGFKETPGKVVVGGPMMGTCLHSINVPTQKAVGGIICMTQKEAALPAVSPCIRCGKCVHICPIHLMPLLLQQRSLLGHFEQANKLHIMDCIECGSCSYICPSHRPLVEAIVYGKNQIIAQEIGR